MLSFENSERPNWNSIFQQRSDRFNDAEHLSRKHWNASGSLINRTKNRFSEQIFLRTNNIDSRIVPGKCQPYTHKRNIASKNRFRSKEFLPVILVRKGVRGNSKTRQDRWPTARRNYRSPRPGNGVQDITLGDDSRVGGRTPDRLLARSSPAKVN